MAEHSPGFTLAEPGLAPGPLWADLLAIARNDHRQLAVWREEGGVKGALLEHDGRLISPRSFLLDDTINPDALQLFGTGDTFTLIVRENGATSWLRVDSDGHVFERHRVDLGGGYALTPFAWNGRHFGVVVSRGQTKQAQLHDLDGSLTHGPFDLGNRAESMGLQAVGDRFLIASNLRLRLVTEEGMSEISRATFSSEFAAVDVRDGWLIAFIETTGEGRRLITLRVNGSLVSENHVVADGDVGTPHTFLETPGGYSLVFGTNESVDSVLLDREGRLVEGSRRTRLEGRPRAWDADTRSIAVLTASRINGIFRINATQLGAEWTLRSVVVSTTFAGQTNPVAAAFDGEGLIAYTELRSAPVIQLVTLRNRRPRLVRSIEGTRLAAQSLPANGSEALLLHHNGSNLVATRLARDGSSLDDDAILISEEATSPQAAAAWTGSQWAIAWIDAVDSQRIRLALLDGIEVDERRSIAAYPRPPYNPHFMTGPELHASGSRLVVAWEEYPDCGGMPCFGADAIVATLDADGDPRAVARFELHSSAPTTATDGRSILLVEAGEARILEETAGVLTARGFWEFRGWDNPMSITWDGDEYVAGSTYHLTARKLSIERFADVTEPPQRKFTKGLHAFQTGPATVAALSADEALLVVEELTPNGRRIVAYLERDMEPAPSPPSAPRSLRTRAGENGATVWEWEAPQSGPVEGYAVEVVYGTSSFVTEILPPETRHFSYFHNDVRIRAFNDGGFSPVQPVVRRRAVVH